MKSIRAGLALAVALAGAAVVRGGDPTVQLTWKQCAGGSSVVSDAQACHVLDLKTGKKTVTFELCAGVNLDGSALVVGGRVSSLVCATVEVPLEGTDKERRQQAETLLRRELEKACRAGTCPLGAVKEVGRFRIVDAAAPKEVRDAARK